MNLREKLSEEQPKIIKDSHQKNFIFFSCVYKMSQISKESFKKCEVEIIDKGRYF